MREPTGGVRTQSVMNMQRDAAGRASGATGRIEQHRGVEPPAISDRNRSTRRQRGKHTAEGIENDALGGGIDERIHVGDDRKDEHTAAIYSTALSNSGGLGARNGLFELTVG